MTPNPKGFTASETGRDDLCICGCPRWEHWRERMTFDWELLALSDACSDFNPAPAAAPTAPKEAGE